MSKLPCFAFSLILLGGGGVQAAQPADQTRPADVTAAQVRAAAANRGHPAELAGKSLKNLDLSGIDLSHADLAGANLFGAKLAAANLAGANLNGANLNLAWLIGANFTGADLTNASLVAPVVAEGLTPRPGEIPVFKNANFTDARVQARFTGGDLAGAKFDGADMSAHMNNQSMGLMRTEMGNADLAGADFSHANLGHAILSYANLRGANFTGADLSDADLTGADASGANFTGAVLKGADLTDTKLGGAKGLRSTKGAPAGK